jgi:hypothetical protein
MMVVVEVEIVVAVKMVVVVFVGEVVMNLA